MYCYESPDCPAFHFCGPSRFGILQFADSIPVNQMIKKRLFDALSKEMNANNIRWSADPDLYLHIHLMMKGNKKANISYGHGETLDCIFQPQ